MTSNRASASNRFLLALTIVAIFATLVGAIGFVRQAWLNEIEIRAGELAAISSSVAFTASAVVEFQQRDAARELLLELNQFPQVDEAVLFDIEGHQIATSSPDESPPPHIAPSHYGTEFSGDGVISVVVPVESAGESIGLLALSGRQPTFTHVLQQFTLPLLGMVLIFCLGALTVGQQFHNRIAAQSDALASTLRRLADSPDVSQRIVLSDDEFAEVSYELNRLLEQLDYAAESPRQNSQVPSLLGVLYLNEKGTIDFCDIGATAILERTSRTVVGHHAAEFFAQLDNTMIERILQDVGRTGRPFSFRASISTSIGATAPLHISIRGMSVNGRTVFHVAMTELKSADKDRSSVETKEFRRNVA